MAGINIREIAADTLVEILEHGQFSHLYLKAVLDKYAYLEKNERAFITRLVNGTVERMLELDYIINNYSKTKVKKMKPLIRTLLRMGAFEIYYMDSVPDSATCNEYVKLAKKRRFAGLSGFMNGVLRNISRDKGNLIINDLGIKYSMPHWIVDKWVSDYGKDKTEEILKGFYESEDLCIRVNKNKIDPAELESRLLNHGIKYKNSEDLPCAGYISNFDSVGSIPEFKEGLFYVQDYSSQLVAHKAGIKSTDKVLDVCAAPGGKALHAAELAKDGSVLACDLTDAKVSLIKENIERAKASNITAQKADASEFDSSKENEYDVVIADLPCSGLGIIRKKPDIKYNQTEDSLVELTTLQAKILDVVCRYVKDGGILSYSTCTINKDENENQVKNFLSSHSEFIMVECEQLLPDNNHDGFFICIMKKN